MRRILIVEDEYQDFVEARRILEREFPGVTVDRLVTESDFRRWLGDPAAPLPDLIILDNMLPWAEPSPDVEPAPEEVSKAGNLTAGLRCYDLLRAHPVRSQVPVIMLTVLRIVCPAGAEYVPKEERERLAITARNLMAYLALLEGRRPATSPRPKLFISYCREDRQSLDEIKRAIVPASLRDPIDVWEDALIKSGLWRPQIERHMRTASGVLFLVTLDFCASSFIRDTELKYFLEAYRDRGTKIMWVNVGASAVQLTPLIDFQCLNDPDRPLRKLSKPDREATLVDIAAKIVAELRE